MYPSLLKSTRIIGSGTLPVDTPAYWNKGRWMNSADGQVYVAVRSFHNEGTDFGDWGRPVGVPEATESNKAFKVRCLTKPSTLTQVGNLISLSGANATIQRQWNIYIENGLYRYSVGFVIDDVSISASLSWDYLTLESNGTQCRLIKNGSVSNWYNNGAGTSTANIYIGGRTDGATSNFEGDTLKAEILDDSGKSLACFNANNPTQWDGGATAQDNTGNPITFTDGSPIGRTAYHWIEESKAIEWGLI